MSLFFRVSGIALTLLVFLGAGVLIGSHRPLEPRFRQVSDTRAFDTKTGQICGTNAVSVPPGLTLQTPYCMDIAKRYP